MHLYKCVKICFEKNRSKFQDFCTNILTKKLPCYFSFGNFLLNAVMEFRAWIFQTNYKCKLLKPFSIPIFLKNNSCCLVLENHFFWFPPWGQAYELCWLFDKKLISLIAQHSYANELRCKMVVFLECKCHLKIINTYLFSKCYWTLQSVAFPEECK